MGEKLVVGPFKGLSKYFLPFLIDNESFPNLVNAYAWRGRVKRKRGTSLLGRLTRYFNSAVSSYGSISGFNLSSGSGNILTSFGLEADGSIIPGTVSLTVGGNTYTDPAEDGTLVGAPTGDGTIHYASGAITITGGGGSAVTAVSFSYYPNLPVLGLEERKDPASFFSATLGFDDTYAYNILPTDPYPIYDVSFYKNPPSSTINGIAYTEKTHITPVRWNGENYRQFWTVNYEGALWATNGVPVPYVSTALGMQFKPCASITYVSSTELTITVTEASQTLVVGDWVFINEVTGTNNHTVNFQTGFVTASVNAAGTTTLTVRFPYAMIDNQVYSEGILQYLTNNSDSTKDCLRWYDGDPTTGAVTPPSLTGHKGWVNFCPPLLSQQDDTFIIDDLPTGQYYLIGAKLIFPFKDRLLFFGPVVQTSTGTPVYLQDTVIYSQNGTAYYTASFDATTAGAVTLPTTIYNPLLVPDNQTAAPNSYFENVTGFGGFIVAGIDQAINSVSSNEDVLILGCTRTEIRLIYTGNDIVPFNFYIINSELGTTSSFSTVNLDQGVVGIGSRGITQTSQVSAQRVDMSIPDEIFQFSLQNNGTQRVCAQRDFINEWIYFTYASNRFKSIFPNTTLLYNYREQSWGLFYESFTTYGPFQRRSGRTWATIGQDYPTWSSWTVPWNAGASTLSQPEVIGGNQQGFVLFRDQGTNEGNSLYIQNVATARITSPDHGLNTGDYIIISGCIGSVSGQLNGNIFVVTYIDNDTFDITGSTPLTGGTYFGGGLIKRMYVPFIQSKQFPTAWNMARKTRIGPSQYLFTGTARGQVTLYLYLSQAGETPFNEGSVYPTPGSPNNALIYSSILYTCVESANLGLTPPNTNLQMISMINEDSSNAASPQNQIWHRMNTSLIGDTVQMAITLSHTQMSDTDFKSQFAEIELHGFILDCSASSLLA